MLNYKIQMKTTVFFLVLICLSLQLELTRNHNPTTCYPLTTLPGTCPKTEAFESPLGLCLQKCKPFTAYNQLVGLGSDYACISTCPASYFVEIRKDNSTTGGGFYRGPIDCNPIREVKAIKKSCDFTWNKPPRVTYSYDSVKDVCNVVSYQCLSLSGVKTLKPEEGCLKYSYFPNRVTKLCSINPRIESNRIDGRCEKDCGKATRVDKGFGVVQCCVTQP